MAHFGHHLLTALPAPLLPMIKSDFKLDYTRSGFVVSAFSLAYGAGQVPAGWLTDRLGARVLVTLGIIGVAAAGLLVGISHTYILLIIFLILMGLLGGGYHPASALALTDSVAPSRRGQALGLHMIGGSASFFLAPLIAAVIAAKWGWRGSFIGLAIPTALFGIAFYVLLGRLTKAKKAEPAVTTGAAVGKVATPGRLSRLVAFIILATTTQAVIFSVISFVPVFMVDYFNVSKETAAALIALIYSCGLWASPLGGYLSDRFGRVPVVVLDCLLAGPVIFMLTQAPAGIGVGAVLVGIGMVSYIYPPVAQAYIIDQVSEKNRATVLGIYFFGNMEGGGLVAPVMGLLADRLGFYSAFGIASVTLLIMSSICALWLWRSRGERLTASI
ncbi:MAG: MFS transporter [Chloroflexota bacterium]